MPLQRWTKLTKGQGLRLPPLAGAPGLRIGTNRGIPVERHRDVGMVARRVRVLT